MKIYSITMDKVDYDEYLGFIVSGKDKKEAIALCNIKETKKEADENCNNLYEDNIESIKVVGNTIKDKKKGEVLLSSYNTG